MGFLYSDEKIAQMKAAWAAAHPEPPKPPTHAERLCELARANATARVKDLAFAAERSTGWVRRVLKQNNVVLIKPPKKLKIKASTLCQCGHPRGGLQRIYAGLPSHCTGGVRHLHWSNPASYTCNTRHCLVEGCGCVDFVSQPKQEGEKSHA